MTLIPLLHNILEETREMKDSTGEATTEARTAEIRAECLALALRCLEQADFQTGWDLAKLFPNFWKAATLDEQAGMVTALLAILQQPESRWEAQWFACQILGGLTHPAIAPALVQHLQTWEAEAEEEDEDDAEDLRAALLAALIQQGGAAISPLQRLLLDPGTRKAGVAALGQIRTRDTVQPLLTVVADPDPTIRAMALEALSSFRDPAIPPILVQGLADLAAAVRRVAVAGLGVRPELVAPMNLLPLMIERLWDLDLGVAQQAAIALGRWGEPAAIPPLVQGLRSPGTAPMLKQTIIQVLGWMAQPQALEAIQAFLCDTAWRESLSEPELVEMAMVLGQQPQDISPATAMLAEQALTIAIQALTAAQPPFSIPVRQALITSLGHLGASAATDVLVKCLTDPELTIRLHAKAALKQINPAEMDG